MEIYFLDEFTFDSRILNYSAGGVMLESDYLLLDWSPVTIKFDAEKKDDSGLEKTCYEGIVRWCSAQEGSCSGFYGVGVEFVN